MVIFLRQAKLAGKLSFSSMLLDKSSLKRVQYLGKENG